MKYLYCRDGIVLAWHEEGQNVPTSAYGEDVYVIPWESLATLQRHGPPPPPTHHDGRPFVAPELRTSKELALYARHKHSLIVAGSIEVNVGTKKEPKLVRVALGGANMSLLYGAHILERGSEYVQDDGNTVSLTPTQVRTVVAAVHAYLQGASATHAQVLAAIEAGTITSKEGVDNPPDPIPAWPTRS